MKRLWSKYVFVFALAVLSGSLLLQVSQDVQRAEDDLRDLERQVRAEQEAVKYLRAEWSYLNTPARLEHLARSYTELMPPSEIKSLIRSDLVQGEGMALQAQSISYDSAGDSAGGAAQPDFSSVFVKAPPVKPKPPQEQTGFSGLMKKLKGGQE